MLVRRIAWLSAVLTISSLLCSPSMARASDTTVLHPLKGLGVDAETVSNLESIIRNELDRLPGMSVIDADRTRRFVESEEVECDGSDPCLAELASDLGAAVAVYGVVGGLGDAYTITLKAVEAQGAEVRSRVQLRVGGAREVLIDGIRAGAFQLLQPDLYVGSLQLDLPEEGAEVYVDGLLVGTTPLTEPVTGLEPGQRALKIVKTGFSDFDRFIEIRFQRTSVVSIDLERSAVSGVIYEEAVTILEEELLPLARLEQVEEDDDSKMAEDQDSDEEEDSDEDWTAPPEGSGAERVSHLRPMRILAYALLGGGGAGLAGGGFQGLSARSQETELSNKFATQGGPLPEDLEAWNRAHTTADRANLLYAAGGVLTAAGAAILIVDIMRNRDDVARASELARGDYLIVPLGTNGELGFTINIAW